MTASELPPIRLHEDPELFGESVDYTSATTGFVARLVEKDYFCSVVLLHLASVSNLVFRGGTCLAKVHAEFYRLSEDLDFVIPTPVDEPRRERSRRATAAKRAVESLDETLGLRAVEPLIGSNESRQYVGKIGYDSVFGSREETIKIEISLREPLRESLIEGRLRTLMLDPIAGSSRIPRFRFDCLTWREAMAEKMRAALCRREVAIRDFYDLDHAVHRQGLDLHDREFHSLLGSKLAVPGNDPVNVEGARLATLRLQLESELKPALRPVDFEGFDLERAIDLVTTMAAAVG